MKTRIFISMVSLLMIVALCVSGCKFSTTVTVEEEEEYDVRILNRSGERAKIRWDNDSYRYLDDGCIISIQVGGGHYELEWADASRSHTRPSKTFTIEVEADIDIVFRDDPDVNFIIID
jgi:hypothetical protein